MLQSVNLIMPTNANKLETFVVVYSLMISVSLCWCFITTAAFVFVLSLLLCAVYLGMFHSNARFMFPCPFCVEFALKPFILCYLMLQKSEMYGNLKKTYFCLFVKANSIQLSWLLSYGNNRIANHI